MAGGVVRLQIVERETLTLLVTMIMELLKHNRLGVVLTLVLALIAIAVGPVPAMPCADRSLRTSCARTTSHLQCRLHGRPGCCCCDARGVQVAPGRTGSGLAAPYSCGCSLQATFTPPPAVMEKTANGFSHDPCGLSQSLIFPLLPLVALGKLPSLPTALPRPPCCSTSP